MNATEQLEQYAACIYGPEDWVEVRCFAPKSIQQQLVAEFLPSDQAGPNEIKHAESQAQAKYGRFAFSHWCRARELASLTNWCTQQNNHPVMRYGVYAGPNPRKSKGLSSDVSVAVFRCLFVDFDHIEADGCGPTEVALTRIEDAGLPAPTLVSFSGHGVHCYWRWVEPINEQRWRNLQERAIAILDSDKAIKNPERVMRLPGFLNTKDPVRPIETFIVQADRAAVYAADDFERRLPPLVAKETPAVPANRAATTGRKEAKARAVLYAAKWGSCGEGERNNQAYYHAAQLRGFDLGDDAWEILTDWNTTNTPPLPEAELRQAFESAKTHAKGTPGEKLAETRPPRQRTQLPATAVGADPASELADLIEAQIDGRYANLPWLGSWLTDLGQCLTPGTRTVLVGGAGASKSLAVLQALSQWLEFGVKVAVLELERGRDFHLARVLAQRSGIADLTKPAWVKQNPGKVRALFSEHREYLNRMGEALHTVPRQFTIIQAAEWVEQRATEGCKIIVLDPVTALMRGKESWADDEQFLARIEKAARTSGASLICVTHPKKGGTSMPDIDNLAGGAAWARFPDAVIWLESHDMKLSTVKTACGADEQKHNRTVWLLKTRSGEGEHLRLAYRFQTGRDEHDNGALTLRELGIIVKTRKG